MPAAGAVTFTSTVQVPLAGTLPPLNDTEAAPATGANVAAPQPVMLAPGVAATTIAPGDVGKGSLNATPASAVPVFGFTKVKRNTAGTLAAIGFVRKLFVMLIGAVATTVRLALAATPVLLFAVAMLPVELLYEPAVGAVTSNLMVHRPPPAMVPFENAAETAFAGGAKVGAPQPLTETLGTAATLIAPGAVGSTSVNATPLIVWLPFGFEIVIVTVEVLPVPMVDGLKALAATGGASVAIVAVVVLPVNALGPLAVTAPLTLV